MVPFGDSRTVDHCYPPMTLWAREEINASNADVRRTFQLEDAILGRHGLHNNSGSPPLFDAFLTEHSLDPRLYNSTPECNCFATSSVGNGTDPNAGPDVPGECEAGGPSMRSPVRDWWDGYADMPMPTAPGSPQRAGIRASQARARRRRLALLRAS